MVLTPKPLSWIQPGVFAGSLAPLVVIATRGLAGRLGANPISTALNQFGLVALILLLASLSCTPLRILFGWTWPLRVRKTLGLFGFFYACLHLFTYAALDQALALRVIFDDVTKRPFILIGFTAFCLLIPLAVTSNAWGIRRLGKNWQRLHRLAYAIGILGVVHFTMRMKSDVTQPLVYGGVLAALLGVRIIAVVSKSRSQI